MPLKDLLVCFDRTDAGYGRLELAFGLAQVSRPFLTGAYVLPEAHDSAAGSVGFGFGPTCRDDWPGCGRGKPGRGVTRGLGGPARDQKRRPAMMLDELLNKRERTPKLTQSPEPRLLARPES